MLSLATAIKQLEKFSEREGISEILTTLHLLAMPGDVDGRMEFLRKELNQILLDPNNNNITTEDGLSLAEVAHNTLISSAEFRPINPKDPILWDPIEEENRVLVSTGYQYDLRPLIQFHYTRAYRRRLGEGWFCVRKYLINPLTNEPFSLRDVVHIRNIANQKGFTIGNLNESNPSVIQPDNQTVQTELADYAVNYLSLLSLVICLSPLLISKISKRFAANSVRFLHSMIMNCVSEPLLFVAMMLSFLSSYPSSPRDMTANHSGLLSLFSGGFEDASASEDTMTLISSSTREEEGSESNSQLFGGYFSALLPRSFFGNNYQRVSSSTQSDESPVSEPGQTAGSPRFGLGSSQDS